MKPIPTPEKIFGNWNIAKPSGCQSPLHAITFAHDTILTALGYEQHGAGWVITIAEPIGEGHRLLVPGKDVIQEGDEFFSSGKWNKFEPFTNGSILNVYVHCVRRPLRNPWRRIEDAPPEHKDLPVLMTGGVFENGEGLLCNRYPDRTHYMLLSDFPPVPSDPPRDLEREKFEAWFISTAEHPNRQGIAWEAWQAARKEKP